MSWISAHALEKEFAVKADLDRVADCLTPSEIGPISEN